MSLTKLIQRISITREVDTDGDDGYLGAYSDTRTSEFSIDRAHTADCQSLNTSNQDTVDRLERAIAYLEKQRWAAVNAPDSLSQVNRDNVEDLSNAQDILIEAQDRVTACDCGGHLARGEYRYFNPSFNYVDQAGKLLDGNTADDVRKYVAQDYARIESRNNGVWGYVGIFACAEVVISGVYQTVKSGGVWGVESDSDAAHIADIAADELAQLRTILHDMGFSKRAIAGAVKTSEVSK